MPGADEPENDDYDGDGQSLGRHEQVDDEDIHDEWAEDGKAEWSEPIDEDEQTGDHFADANEVHVSSFDHGGEEMTDRAGRRWLPGQEVEEMVGAGKYKNGSEKDPGDEGGDFQRVLLKGECGYRAVIESRMKEGDGKMQLNPWFRHPCWNWI